MDHSIWITNMEQHLESMKISIASMEQKHHDITNEINQTEQKIQNIDKNIEMLEKVAIILATSSSSLRESARVHFEKIVTYALQYITQSNNYSFVIKVLPERKVPSYEFYIKSMVNGVESLQKPEESNGGGFVDIISVALKYAYQEVFNDPKIMNGTLFYDEPGKMISENMSVKFAEYIKFLNSNYKKQTIMITHNQNIIGVADKTFVVTKGNDNISKVTEMKEIKPTEYQNLLDTVEREVQYEDGNK